MLLQSFDGYLNKRWFLLSRPIYQILSWLGKAIIFVLYGFANMVSIPFSSRVSCILIHKEYGMRGYYRADLKPDDYLYHVIKVL